MKTATNKSIGYLYIKTLTPTSTLIYLCINTDAQKELTIIHPDPATKRTTETELTSTLTNTQEVFINPKHCHREHHSN